MAWLASMATCTSSSARSTWAPRPVRSRRARAASTAVAAYMPVRMSAMATPTFMGPPPGAPSGSPVMLMRPPSPWTMKS